MDFFSYSYITKVHCTENLYYFSIRPIRFDMEHIILDRYDLVRWTERPQPINHPKPPRIKMIQLVWHGFVWFGVSLEQYRMVGPLYWTELLRHTGSGSVQYGLPWTAQFAIILSSFHMTKTLLALLPYITEKGPVLFIVSQVAVDMRTAPTLEYSHLVDSWLQSIIQDQQTIHWPASQPHIDGKPVAWLINGQVFFWNHGESDCIGIMNGWMV